MFLRAASAVAVSLLLVALQSGDDEMTPCEELQAAVAAETDPTKKAALQRDYRAHCLLNGDQQPNSGGNGPGPIKPN